jgi:transaldolase
MSKITAQLHNDGVSLWLENITRNLLDDGILQHYIDNENITDLTTNPSIFDQAVTSTMAYDSAILEKSGTGKSKDPALPLGCYIDNLLAPYTINTMPEKTMLAYADSGEPGMALAPDGGDAKAVILEYEHAGINYFQLAAISRTGQQQGQLSSATR